MACDHPPRKLTLLGVRGGAVILAYIVRKRVQKIVVLCDILPPLKWWASSFTEVTYTDIGVAP